MTDDRDFDRLIDAALGTYADSSVNSNLAEHVLTRITNEPAPHPRHRWLPWTGIAVPVAVCLLLLFQFNKRITQSHPVSTTQSARLSNSTEIPAHPDPLPIPEANRPGPIKHAVSHPRSFAVKAAPHSIPKLGMFPSPSPLTRQERALAIYVAQTPKAARRALAQSEQEQIPPTIASIHIMQIESFPVITPEAIDEGANTN